MYRGQHPRTFTERLRRSNRYINLSYVLFLNHAILEQKLMLLYKEVDILSPIGLKLEDSLEESGYFGQKN